MGHSRQGEQPNLAGLLTEPVGTRQPSIFEIILRHTTSQAAIL